MRIAHGIIEEAFSERVIHPGITSTEDVIWWLRERVWDLNLITWFHPSVSIQRGDPESFDHLRTFDSRPSADIIMPGDLLHVDFGITYLRLNTDTQADFYVLKPGETEVPSYLVDAFDAEIDYRIFLPIILKKGAPGMRCWQCQGLRP